VIQAGDEMGGWGCPHEVDGKCLKVNNRVCDPGMKGCILFGRFVFSNEAKNRPDGPRRRDPHKSTTQNEKKQR
jgi:hypothetical protein